MDFDLKLLNDSDLSIYNNIERNFKNSININDDFREKIDDAYHRTLLNLAKTSLSLFNLKYLEMFEELANYYKNDNQLYDFSKSLIEYMNSYFIELNDNLNIKNKKDFDELNFILKISSIAIEGAIEDKDIPLAYEAFFQIERKINREKLYKKSINVVKSGEFNLKFFINDDYIDFEHQFIENHYLRSF